MVDTLVRITHSYRPCLLFLNVFEVGDEFRPGMFWRRELFGDPFEAFLYESIVKVQPNLARKCVQAAGIVDQREINVPRILFLKSVVKRHAFITRNATTDDTRMLAWSRPPSGR